MSKVIVFTNQKGGVGKTTLTREIALYLASTGKKILLLDMDPQCNLTKSLIDNPRSNLYDAFKKEDYRIDKIRDSLYLIAGSINLNLIERANYEDGYSNLKEIIEKQKDYGYIFIDCAPTLGILTLNALSVAAFAVIPLCATIYSIYGTADLIDVVNKVKKTVNPSLSIAGFILNGYDGRSHITEAITYNIKDILQEKVFTNYLSHSVKIEQAISLKKGANEIAASHKIAKQISLIAKELIERVEIE